MHDDATVDENLSDWGPYLSGLRSSGNFDGGSSLGSGSSHRKGREPHSISGHLVGYLMVSADDLAAASIFLAGNPVYEAGGTVQIRQLIED
jgi:hypothetical protein